MQQAITYPLQDDLIIKLVSPVYFVTTKIEAYKGRGNNDPLQSRDIEDILNVFDGRAELVKEINQANVEVKDFISKELGQLLEHPDFEYAVQSTAQGQADREELIFKRLEAVIK